MKTVAITKTSSRQMSAIVRHLSWRSGRCFVSPTAGNVEVQRT